MEITFVAHSRLLGYRPGQVVKMDLKDVSAPLRAVLKLGRHITLIDPLELPDDGEESSTNSEEYRTPYFGVDGQSNKKSSGKREDRATGDTGAGNGGNGTIS